MYLTHLLDLAEFIKEHNPYFANGFAGAWQDAETGQIWVDAGGRKPVFPEDRYGNMFYIRVSNMTFQEAEYFPLVDCQISGTDTVINCFLIAVVREADPLMLIARLTNTLALYSSASVKLISALETAEDVVLAELNKADDAARRAAIQRVRNQAVISINFTFRTPSVFQALDCLPPICPEC